MIILVFHTFCAPQLVNTKLSAVLKCALGHFKHHWVWDYWKHTLFHMTWLLVLVAWTCVFNVIQLCFHFPKSRAVCYIDLKTCKHQTKRGFCLCTVTPLSILLFEMPTCRFHQIRVPFNHNSGNHWGFYISTNAYNQPHKAWPNNVLKGLSLCLYIKSKILCSFHSLQSFKK